MDQGVWSDGGSKSPSSYEPSQEGDLLKRGVSGEYRIRDNTFGQELIRKFCSFCLSHWSGSLQQRLKSPAQVGSAITQESGDHLVKDRNQQAKPKHDHGESDNCVQVGEHHI